MRMHMDVDKVRAAAERAKESLRVEAAKPGTDGGVARMQMALITPFYEQLAEELNLNTEPNDVAFAISATFADLMNNFVMSVLGDEDASPEETQPILTGMVMNIVSCFAQIDAGTAKTVGTVEEVVATRMGEA